MYFAIGMNVLWVEPIALQISYFSNCFAAILPENLYNIGCRLYNSLPQNKCENRRQETLKYFENKVNITIMSC